MEINESEPIKSESMKPYTYLSKYLFYFVLCCFFLLIDNPQTFAQCSPTAPSVSQGGTVCIGESVSMTAWGCDAGFEIQWYENTSLTQLVGSGSTVSTPPLTADISCYASCVSTSDPNCKSPEAGVSFTVVPRPTITIGTPSCNGNTYSVTFDASNYTNATSNTGYLAGNQVSNIPSGQTLTITVSNGYCSESSTTSYTCDCQPQNISVNSPTICSGTNAMLTVSGCTGEVMWIDDGNYVNPRTVSPSATITYTAICIVGDCETFVDATVTVSSNTSTNLSVNSPTICSGVPVYLIVDNCSGTATWSTGYSGNSIQVMPYVTTSYTVTCSDGNCSETATSTVTVNTTPSIRINDATICIGETATLTASECNGTISWSTGETTTSITVSPSSTTTYSATCYENSCDFSATTTVTVNPKPSITILSTTCSADKLTYSVSFNTTLGATVTSNKGSVSGTAIINIPTGQTVTITATLGGCYTSTNVTENCSASSGCIKPNAGTDITLCLPMNSADLIDAPSGYQWVVGTGNPKLTTVDGTTGTVTGLTIEGTYQYTIQKIGDVSCSDFVRVVVNRASEPITLCNDGSTSYHIYAPSGLTNILWFNMANQQVGGGEKYIVTSNSLGLADGNEAYYYTSENQNSTCPVTIKTQHCCNQKCIDLVISKN